MTWRAESGGTLTWHAGQPRGCDAALRPRGMAAGGPCGAQVAHRARTHGRGQACPHGSTRTPMWGATWQGGRQMEGPRVSGPWLGDSGGNANVLPRPTF